jgi:hypothetical protein
MNIVTTWPALIHAATWNIWGSIFAGVGALFGLAGTLMMAHGYFVMPFTEFMLQVPRYIFLALVGKRSELEDEATLSTANDERRTDTLIGLCQLVFGFFLQVIGVALLYFGTIPD